MKNIFLFVLAIILVTSCEEKAKEDQRYTEQSSEIETFKKVIADYQAQDWESVRKHYADTAKIMNNTTKENALTIDLEIAENKEDAAMFTSWKYDPENTDYEMIVTDDGETWVNFWGDWEGTLKENNKVYIIPVHITARFVDGLIVREFGYWDFSNLSLDLQKIEMDKNMSVDEKVMKSSMETVVKAWNSNDKNLMASVMTDNFTRTENGNVVIKSSAEYATKLMDLFFGAFPDFKVTLNKSKFTGNQVHINWTCTGTNTKPFQGNPATNKAITTHGHSIWTMNSDGKFSREDAYYDNLILFNQLGYSMPAPIN